MTALLNYSLNDSHHSLIMAIENMPNDSQSAAFGITCALLSGSQVRHIPIAALSANLKRLSGKGNDSKILISQQMLR